MTTTTTTTTTLFPYLTDPGPCCTDPVRRASMWQRWDLLTFIHWPYEPSTVQRLLPPGLEVETFDGCAWVSLVPFVLQITAPRCGPVPWLSSFPETNLRTYVRATDGSTGVWFFSLDAARLAAVVAARSTWGLPYFWSSMRVDQVGPVMTYRSRRRRPGPVGARSDVAVRIGAPLGPDELGARDHWLTARWRLYRSHPAGIRVTAAEHPPWPLYRATLLHQHGDLAVAAGLPEPREAPIVHWSPGVPVRIGFPRTVNETTEFLK